MKSFNHLGVSNKFFNDLPPHLKNIVIGQEPRGSYICFHNRPLTICAICAPEAEKLYKEHKDNE